MSCRRIRIATGLSTVRRNAFGTGTLTATVAKRSVTLEVAASAPWLR